MAAPKLVPRTLSAIRSSKSRWEALRVLVVQLERLTQANLAIDLASRGRGPAPSVVAGAAVFEQSLALVEKEVARELARLTVEGLDVELLHKQRKDGQR